MPLAIDEVEFLSHGITVRAGVFHPDDRTLASDRGLPCVVMGHGLGGTRSAGLEPFARHFSEAGMMVLCFDYRGLGGSEGEPRQCVDVRMQLDDWHAAIGYARNVAGADPDRIGLWGSSLSGRHVVAVAAEDGDVAAISAQGAMLDGLAALKHLIRSNGVAAVMKLSTYAGLAAKLRCPALFCITEKDAVVPPAAMEDAARQADDWAKVKQYPIGHFEIYVGDGFRQAAADQADFFVRHLGLRRG